MSLDLEKFTNGLHDYMARALAPLADRLKALEDELVQVKSKGVAYKGVWQAASDYSRGDLVTFEGSMWHANAETRSKPGQGSEWTLAVKRGDTKRD